MAVVATVAVVAGEAVVAAAAVRSRPWRRPSRRHRRLAGGLRHGRPQHAGTRCAGRPSAGARAPARTGPPARRETEGGSRRARPRGGAPPRPPVRGPRSTHVRREVPQLLGRHRTALPDRQVVPATLSLAAVVPVDSWCLADNWCRADRLRRSGHLDRVVATVWWGGSDCGWSPGTPAAGVVAASGSPSAACPVATRYEVNHEATFSSSIASGGVYRSPDSSMASGGVYRSPTPRPGVGSARGVQAAAPRGSAAVGPPPSRRLSGRHASPGPLTRWAPYRGAMRARREGRACACGARWPPAGAGWRASLARRTAGAARRPTRARRAPRGPQHVVSCQALDAVVRCRRLGGRVRHVGAPARRTA